MDVKKIIDIWSIIADENLNFSNKDTHCLGF